jgi:hypothetical protein
MGCLWLESVVTPGLRSVNACRVHKDPAYAAGGAHVGRVLLDPPTLEK